MHFESNETTGLPIFHLKGGIVLGTHFIIHPYPVHVNSYSQYQIWKTWSPFRVTNGFIVYAQQLYLTKFLEPHIN